MMIMMHKDDPLFGRENETPQEVAANWTKVYVPEQFRIRIFALFFLQWICTITVSSSISIFPCILFLNLVIVGRFFFNTVNYYTVVKIEIPKSYNYEGHFTSIRRDLPNHDFYSYFAGVFILYVISLPFRFIHSRFSRVNLIRRNSIRRYDVRNRVVGGLVGSAYSDLATNPRTLTDKFYIWWQRKGRYQTMMYLKALYLSFFLLFLIPLCFGLVFDIYILSTLSNQTSTHIVYAITDWAIGIIFCNCFFLLLVKCFYNISQLLPDNPLNELITNSIRLGLACDLWLISTKIIFPFIVTMIALLALPIYVTIVERMLGIIY